MTTRVTGVTSDSFLPASRLRRRALPVRNTKPMSEPLGSYLRSFDWAAFVRDTEDAVDDSQSSSSWKP